MLITSDLQRLNIGDFQLVEGGGPKATIEGQALGVRVDNKDRAIMVRSDDPLDFNEAQANYGDRVYLSLKVDDAAINSVSVRLTLDTPWSGDDASVGNYAEWDVDMTDYVPGTWKRVVIDPRNQPFDRQGPMGVGSESKWRWVGVRFDIGNVGGRSANCWVSKIDIGTGIKIQDQVAPALNWSDIAALDEMVQVVGPNQYEIIGDIEFENISFNSVVEQVTLKGTNLVVGVDTDYQTAGNIVNGEGDVHLDHQDAAFVSIAGAEYNNVIGSGFVGYSVRFADNSLHTVMNSTFNGCGLVVQQTTQFNNVTIVNPVPQQCVFDFVEAHQVVSGLTHQGTTELAQAALEFQPFVAFNDNAGDIYQFGATVPFNKIFWEGDLFGGTGEHQWFYWNIAGWTPLLVIGDASDIRNLHGEVSFVAPPGWQKLNGLYQIQIVIDGLWAVSPDPAHKFAFYTPVV
jgi:hypothetical protein